MTDQTDVKAAWVTPELTIYGKVEEITQDTWKRPGVGDGIIVCIGETAISVESCAPC